jgi:hypothetical protein
MPQPMICLDADVRQCAECCRVVFSKPHYEYVVTVLLGLLECEGRRTLSGIVSKMAHPPSVSGVRRFLSGAPWMAEALVVIWLEHVRTEMQPALEAEREQQRQNQPKRRGRPTDPLVTGSLMGDDSTMRKPKGRTMEGLGTHHSTTHEQRIVGHSLVAGRSMLLDRRYPLAPQVDRQEKVCESEAVAFQSTIALMETFIRTCEPVVGTRTHMLWDSWSCATCLWRAVRDRAFLITTGLTSTRWLRISDDTAAQGWRWQKLRDDLAGLSEQDGVQTTWPRGGKAVDVHIVTTSVRTLSRCHVVIVCHSPSALLSQARYWDSSDLEAAPSALLVHISARWDSEAIFADGKEELGLDHCALCCAITA